VNHVPAPSTAETTPPVRTLAQALASPPAAPGHFDELRGRTHTGTATPPFATHSIADHAGITDIWSQFFAQCETDGLGDLAQRNARLQRQLHDNGVACNAYRDDGGPQRPWSPELLPLILPPASWQHIEAGIAQRMRLLDRVLADVYGPQQLLARRLLPPALVQGHPGYARALHGWVPPGGTHLHLAAFDLAHGPDGHWWVVSQHTQAPAGLGHLLENRLAVSPLFARACESLAVQHLGSTYRALVHSLQRMSPAGQGAHLALLTPGPYSATYFEHAFLARHLGMTLVEGRDLVVRDLRLYLRTLRGLVPIHGLLKCLDDAYLDPLELQPDSALGVPGLLQAMRAGHVLVANAPGSAFLESPALLGFLPALSQHLLGETLRLPALPTWWCGERPALEDALPRLAECVIRPTYPDSPAHAPVQGRELDPQARQAWAARLRHHGDDYTLQTEVPLSQMPTWAAPDPAAHTADLVPRPVMLRVFAVSDGTQSWRVLPGGLAQVQGGGSADVWALNAGPVDPADRLPPPLASLVSLTPPPPLAQPPWISRRAAENLFWLGRYAERADNQARLAQLTLACLSADAPPDPTLLAWLERMTRYATLVPPDCPPLTPAPQTLQAFAHTLVASLGTTTSAGYNLRAMRLAGAAVRERLPQAHWNLIRHTEETFFSRCAEPAAAEAARDTLQHTRDQLATLAGLQAHQPREDDGWLLLDIGRHLERLGFLSSALQHGLASGAVQQAHAGAVVAALFDPALALPTPPLPPHDAAALLHRLVQDRSQPQSLSQVAHTLRSLLARLAGSSPPPSGPPVWSIPDPGVWPPAGLHEAGADKAFTDLTERLAACGQAVYQVAHALGATYFTHAGEAGHSLGT
jgi:uncharacterized circularly permuted ATP-grasp superfamily protein/uncharacterized alpha-E superfamily protein